MPVKGTIPAAAEAGTMRFMLNRTYPDTPLKPFSLLDYVLCAISCLLSGIAFVPEVTRLIFSLVR